MRAYFSDHYVLPLPPQHRFPMAKYARLRARVGGLAGVTLHEAPLATVDELVAAHDQDYVDRCVSGRLSDAEVRRIGFPWSPRMIERSRRSAGATLAAARAVVVDGDVVAVNLAGGTHHAGPDFGAGYCVFNDVAVAVRVLRRDGRARRALVVDLDVHQGDGTAAILGADDGVFTLSLHGRNNFPFRKQTSSLDVELDDGCGDVDYLAHVGHALGVAFADCKRGGAYDVVFYLAGADPYDGDLLGKLSVSKAGLAERDAAVFAACAAHDVGVVVVMAGGYAKDVEDIVDIHAETVRQAAALSTSRGVATTGP